MRPPRRGGGVPTTSHGIIGGVGYTSSMHRTLAPALQQRLRDRDPALGSGPGLRRRQVHSSPNRRPARRQLSQQDLDYLRDNEERNRQVFEAWRQAKEEERSARAAQEERQRLQSLHLFLHKEVQLKEACEATVSDWERRKAAQASLVAAQRLLCRHEGRREAASARTRSEVVQMVNREREERFLLQTDPHALPTRFGFYSTLT